MFTTISPYELDGNLFSRLDRQWMLITAGQGGAYNTMTASWGSFGVLWNKPVAVCYIRPQRHTLQFVEAQARFTLSFLPEEYRSQLTLCGTKSGRDVDKIAACGFHVLGGEEGTPYFAEAELALVCRKLYVDRLRAECFLAPELNEKFYKDDYHLLFIAEILEVLQK